MEKTLAGRPRLYATNAGKTRAYRDRLSAALVPVDRGYFEQTQADLRRLAEAVIDATRVGDPLASALDTITKHDLLESLAQHFEKIVREHPVPAPPRVRHR
jgi:hypothetical protein